MLWEQSRNQMRTWGSSFLYALSQIFVPTKCLGMQWTVVFRVFPVRDWMKEIYLKATIGLFLVKVL